MRTFAEVMAIAKATPDERDACAWWLAQRRAKAMYEFWRTDRIRRGKHPRKLTILDVLREVDPG